MKFYKIMLKKIVVASDSFKGSLTSLDVAQNVEKAIREVYPLCDVLKVNVADGGEGTMEALQQTLGGVRVSLVVKDPLGREIEATYVILNDGITAVVEMSAASGLPLLKSDERNPLKTSTYGTGQLICDALDRGCRKILVGIGGSATNDAGMGMLQALGYRFLDAQGNQLQPVGENLQLVSSIDSTGRHPDLDKTEFVVACDVKAPLYGRNGAAYVFAPQKGADQKMVEMLDAGLRHFSEVSSAMAGYDCSQMQGTGAAGGLGYAFRQYLDARLERGIEMVLDAIGFDDIISGADLVITGEGRVDSQTLTGKTPFGVAQHAHRQRIPVVVIGGSVEIDVLQVREAGFNDVIQVTPLDMPLSVAMRPEVAAENVYNAIIKYLTDHE